VAWVRSADNKGGRWGKRKERGDEEEVREKLDMLTLRCLCCVVGLGQLGSRHVVGNDRFRGHIVCTLYSGIIVVGMGTVTASSWLRTGMVVSL